MTDQLRCPECGLKTYRIENFDGKGFCTTCSMTYNENRFRWLRTRCAKLAQLLFEAREEMCNDNLITRIDAALEE